MTWEELQTLAQAREIIKSFDKAPNFNVENLNEPYKGAYEKLDEVIKRWETIP